MSTATVNSTVWMSVRRSASWSLKLAFAITLTFFFWFLTTPASDAHAQDVVYHSVRAGESLSSIARSYGVTVSTILQNNRIPNPDVLRVGQTLTIPRTTQPPAPVSTRPPVQQPAPTVPVVPTDPPVIQKPTSTPSLIYIPPVSLPDPSPTVEKPVPTPTPGVSILRYYTVRPGDTLYGIAARYGVNVSAIRSRNRLSGDVIYPGQSLAIP